MAATALRRYVGYGCRISSAIPLFGLRESGDSALDTRIDIRWLSPQTRCAADQLALAGYAEAADGSRSWTLPGQLEWRLQRHSEPVQCAVRGDAAQFSQFFIRSGIRQALAMLGRGWLRASAVAWCGRAVLIAGPSACGKSVAAAALVQRGASLLSDHGVALRDGPGGLWAMPGSQAHELWPDAMAQIDGASSATAARAGVPKSCRAAQRAHGEPLPVGGILVPAYRPGATDNVISQLRGTQRLRMLIASQEGVEGVGPQLMRLATEVPVLSYARPLLPVRADFLAALGDALVQRLSSLAWPDQPHAG